MKSLVALTAALTAALALLAGCATSSSGVSSVRISPGNQTAQSFTATVTKTNHLNYLLYLPKDYGTDTAKKFPLVLFLHGAGERGTNLMVVAKHGPPKQVAAGREFPFILASPQCPEGQVWDDDALLSLVDTLQSELRVDAHHIYVTGLSMGGYGTWSLASKHPERFAAVAPVCGGGERIRTLLPTQREALKTLGVWAFHGGKDNVVALSESERMVDAFKKAGVTDIQLTVYPEDGHDSWTHAYNEPTFYDWLLKHSR
ncbi:MAG TPA: prolyl oligopeptidase family serine peptidase [Candidatus Limnocylindria bacterium]|nr:prolyl oligopeptidase family serine peptidase [Candidatus Limnocylindria bacterium]